MKKIIYLLSLIFMLAPFNAKAVDEKEEKLFGYYNKAASCAVAYNYQQRYAKIANLIDNGTNSANLLVNLQPSVSAWITISITLEQMLIKHYSWTKDSITAYRRDQFDRINFISGRDFFHKPPEEYLGILFNVTSECPKLAVEIQEFVMGFGTNITPDPAPDTTDDKPKRKM